MQCIEMNSKNAKYAHSYTRYIILYACMCVQFFFSLLSYAERKKASKTVMIISFLQKWNRNKKKRKKPSYTKCIIYFRSAVKSTVFFHHINIFSLYVHCTMYSLCCFLAVCVYCPWKIGNVISPLFFFFLTKL